MEEKQGNVVSSESQVSEIFNKEGMLLPWAAVTKYHQLGSLQPQKQSWRPGNQRLWCWQDPSPSKSCREITPLPRPCFW